MSLASDRRNHYRAIANRVRAIPGEHGLRPYRVEVLIVSWSGARTGEGVRTESSLEILESGQPPKVRFVNDEERMLSNLPAGSIDVGPITPDHLSGGTTWDDLTGESAATHEQVLYRVTGPEFPNGALYVREQGNSARAIQYKLRLRPRALEAP